MNRVYAIATRGDRAEAAKALQAGISPDQKLKAMDPEIARNQDHDHHDANDSKDVHSVLLHSMTVARAVCLYAVYPPLAQLAWLAYPLSPPSISPVAASSEEQKEYEDNKNEVHFFLQNIIFSLLYIWVHNYYLPAPPPSPRWWKSYIPATLTEMMSGQPFSKY